MSRAVLGFVGLGAMGRPMASRLLDAGYEVHIYDIAEAAVRAIQEVGGRPAGSPRDVGAAAEVILMSLPNSQHIEEVTLGRDGLIEGVARGKVVIDLSSARPSSTRRLAAAFAERGVDFLDAPVSRGVPSAVSGTLSIMVGGEAAVYDRSLPILRVLGTDILHVGGVGAGHALKCLNNLVAATNLVAANEIVLMASALGLDPARVVEVIVASSGRTDQMQNRIGRYVLTRTYSSNFGLGLMYKDVQTAVELAQELDVPIFVTDVARQLYALAVNAGMAGQDNQMISRFLERLLGQTLETVGSVQRSDGGLGSKERREGEIIA